MTSNRQDTLRCEIVTRVASDYPANLLRVFGETAPPCLYTLGHRASWCQPFLAMFCSERCPGDLIIEAGDVATALRETGVAVISGFHLPVERESLRILLHGTQPVIVCTTRSIERTRLPAEWRDPILEDRLLLISPFTPKQNRMTAALAAQRNEFVAALASAVLIVYADAGGLIEKLARTVLKSGGPLFPLDDPSNRSSSS
jgi:predicted Rossmann fold nucleotide-binding protein DprA/Smf involved in DNA uptake